MLKESIRENKKLLLGLLFLLVLFTGGVGMAIATYVVVFGYLDSRHLAFDSPELEGFDAEVEIGILEKGY